MYMCSHWLVLRWICNISYYIKLIWFIPASRQNDLSLLPEPRFDFVIIRLLILTAFKLSYVFALLILITSCLYLIFVYDYWISLYQNEMVPLPSPLRFAFQLYILKVCLDKRVLEITLFNTTCIWFLITVATQTGLA